MNAEQRVAAYRRQPGATRRGGVTVISWDWGVPHVLGLTPRQASRVRHKANHQARAAREATAAGKTGGGSW